MRYALFLGCWIQTQQYGYEMSTRRTMPLLGVELRDPEGFSCCGYPLRSLNDAAWFYLSARNLAVAERDGLDMLPLCNGCYASLNEVKHYLDSDPEFKDSVNEALSLEGLEYKGTNRVRHVLEVLHQDVGIDRIKDTITTPLDGLSFATHCGCHALRPSDFRYTDDPEDPRMLDDLTRALGAEAKYYPEKLDCCGASLVISDYEAAFKITGAKLQAVQRRVFDGLVTNCPFCFKMFDSRQEVVGKIIHDEGLSLPVFYITQLLGLALGLDEFDLGLGFNHSPVEAVIERVGGRER
ncbi:CoB--CoM heterodisulfide reductase iron-sulfur subunit B family protein [Candidatus Bathyarchaeota archaeon]|nr:CoB--CoM heterodisulfide reductase iron-sulfur subunit B family protein [Candidatus Bathyarchaeota archaeon]